MKNDRIRFVEYLLCIFLLIGVSGCANQPYVLNKPPILKSFEQDTSDKAKQKLFEQAELAANEFNSVMSCLREKEKVISVTSWGNIAYISAAFSGVATMGTSTATAGVLGAFSGFSKYMGDENQYSKAIIAIDTPFRTGMDSFIKSMRDGKYDAARGHIEENKLIVRLNHLSCPI